MAHSDPALGQTIADGTDAPAERYLRLWLRGDRPDLNTFLASQPPLAPTDLAAVLRVDQRERWQRGDRVYAESYLKQYAALNGNQDLAFNLIHDEFLLRERLGEKPQFDEYARRFPDLAPMLLDQIKRQKGAGASIDGRGTITHVGDPAASEVPPAPSVIPDEIGNYSILRVIGRGGMGIVYQGWHRGLHRLAAVKQVLGGEHAHPDAVARFRNEAEAVARLQHPNVVQVYEVGQEHGRWFLALEYVDGGSLAQHLGGTPQPARRAAELVETCARAVHYAHERGIVHRDLTPANVLLTRDGIPKITDFGLAKLLVGGEPGQTQTGAILGTPSYMAPEQAAGEAKRVGPAADVYNLGAILYDMLTGRPPFKAETPLETVLQVVQQEPVSPRALQPKLPRDLETICLKCLRKEPGRRYVTAAALADDLRRFQAGEPIAARPTGSVERAIRWMRRKPLAAGLAASLAGMLVVVTVVSVLFALHSERARQAVAQGQTEITRERDEKAKALVAEINARQAEKQARDKALSALRAMTDEIVEKQMARGGQLTEEDREFLRQIIKHFEDFAAITANDEESRAIRAEGYHGVGLMRSRLGEYDEAEAAYVEAVAQRQRLVADFPDRPEFRQELARSQANLGLLRSDTGKPKEAEEATAAALAIRQRLATDFPTRPDFRKELARSHNNLGNLFRETGRLPEAEASYGNALTVQKQLTAEFPGQSEYRSDLSSTHYNLGNLLRDTDRLAEAEAAFGALLAIRKQLVADFPGRPEFRFNLARTQINLANLLRASGRLQAAAAAHDAALALHKQLAAEFPTRPEFRHELGISLCNLGRRHNEAGRPTEAEAAYTEALALQKQLASDFPSRPEFRQEAASCHDSLAGLLQNAGRAEESERHYAAALELRQHLATDFPTRPEFRQQLANSQCNLAILLADTSRPKEAEQSYVAALTIQRQLTREFPTRSEFRQDLAVTQNGLGVLLQGQGRLSEAETTLVEALVMRKQLAKEFPTKPDLRNEVAGTYVNIAVLRRAQKDLRGAKAFLEEATPHHEAALRANSQHPTYREFYQNNLGELIQTNAGLGDPPGAIRAAEKVRDLGWDAPGDAYDAACYLARCILIVQAVENATKQASDKQISLYGDEAMKMLRVAVAKGWKDAAHVKEDTDLDPLRRREDFKKLVAELEAKPERE